MKRNLRLVEPIDAAELAPERPPMVPLRFVLAWMTRQAVLTVALVGACGYVITGTAMIITLYQDPTDPWRGIGIGLLFTLLLIVGIKTMRALSRPPVNQGGGEVVLEQHHHHHHYHGREGA
jgi:hypothetical protein